MKLYFVSFSMLIAVLATSSCKRSFNCTCTTRSTQKGYIEEMKAVNKEDASKMCRDYMYQTNTRSFPGVDCELN